MLLFLYLAFILIIPFLHDFLLITIFYWYYYYLFFIFSCSIIILFYVIMCYYSSFYSWISYSSIYFILFYLHRLLLLIWKVNYLFFYFLRYCHFGFYLIILIKTFDNNIIWLHQLWPIFYQTYINISSSYIYDFSIYIIIGIVIIASYSFIILFPLLFTIIFIYYYYLFIVIYIFLYILLIVAIFDKILIFGLFLLDSFLGLLIRWPFIKIDLYLYYILLIY